MENVWIPTKILWMWHLRAWFSGGLGSTGGMVGLTGFSKLSNSIKSGYEFRLLFSYQDGQTNSNFLVIFHIHGILQLYPLLPAQHSPLLMGDGLNNYLHAAGRQECRRGFRKGIPTSPATPLPLTLTAPPANSQIPLHVHGISSPLRHRIFPCLG